MTHAPPQPHTLLEQRYGSQAKPDNIIWNDRIVSLLQHRSVRDFLPDALPIGAVETMVAAAQSASTSSNLHQWSVVLVTDPALKDKVADLASGRAKSANGFIRHAPAVLLWVADLSRSEAIVHESGGQAEVHDYLDAFLMASIDASLAAQNAAVAAESIGLGVVYIGAMRNEARQLAELIGLPRYSFVTFGMVVGTPATDPAEPDTVRPRPSQQVVLHHNRYDAERSMAGLDAYDAAFSAYRQASGMSQRTWRETVAHAKTMAYLDGREHLRQTVVERGFKLR